MMELVTGATAERWNHIARLTDASQYIKLRYDYDCHQFEDGVSANFGTKGDGVSEELQAVFFDPWVFTEKGARLWIEQHEFTAIAFLPATVKIDAAEDRGEPRIIERYKLLEPGHYDMHPTPQDVSAQDCIDFCDAINAKAGIGVPTAIKYQHLDGAKAIGVGLIPSAWMEDEAVWGTLRIMSDARYDGAIIATVDQIADGLEGAFLQGSMEAYRDYSSESYTAGRTYGLWPTAWAVLPAGEQPAVPPRLMIASDDATQTAKSAVCIYGAPEGGDSPTERGQEMEIQEKLTAAETRLTAAEERVKALETENAELADKVAEHDRVEAEAMVAKAAELEKSVMDLVKAGKRDALKAKLAAMDSDALRVQFLEAMLTALEEPVAEAEVLDAGETGDEADEANAIAKQKTAINAAADAHKLDMRTIQGRDSALEYATRDNPELFK